jgi:hypothetical protein
MDPDTPESAARSVTPDRTFGTIYEREPEAQRANSEPLMNDSASGSRERSVHHMTSHGSAERNAHNRSQPEDELRLASFLSLPSASCPATIRVGAAR